MGYWENQDWVWDLHLIDYELIEEDTYQWNDICVVLQCVHPDLQVEDDYVGWSDKAFLFIKLVYHLLYVCFNVGGLVSSIIYEALDTI